MNLQNLPTTADVWRPNKYLAIEAAGSTKGRVDGINPVRRSYDNDRIHAFETIHQRQELCYGAGIRMHSCLPSLGRERIQFIDENDRRCMVSGFAEDSSQIAFGFTG